MYPLLLDDLQGEGEASNNSAKLIYNALYDISMKRLKLWLEIDEDKAAEEAREDLQDKLKQVRGD